MWGDEHVIQMQLYIQRFHHGTPQTKIVNIVRSGLTGMAGNAALVSALQQSFANQAMYVANVANTCQIDQGRSVRYSQVHTLGIYPDRC